LYGQLITDVVRKDRDCDGSSLGCARGIINGHNCRWQNLHRDSCRVTHRCFTHARCVGECVLAHKVRIGSVNNCIIRLNHNISIQWIPGDVLHGQILTTIIRQHIDYNGSSLGCARGIIHRHNGRRTHIHRDSCRITHRGRLSLTRRVCKSILPHKFGIGGVKHTFIGLDRHLSVRRLGGIVHGQLLAIVVGEDGDDDGSCLGRARVIVDGRDGRQLYIDCDGCRVAQFGVPDARRVSEGILPHKLRIGSVNDSSIRLNRNPSIRRRRGFLHGQLLPLIIRQHDNRHWSSLRSARIIVNRHNGRRTDVYRDQCLIALIPRIAREILEGVGALETICGIVYDILAEGAARVDHSIAR